MNLSIGKKLYLGFTLLLAFVFIGLTVVYKLSSENVSFQSRVTELRIPTALASKDLINGVNSSLASLRGYMILGKDAAKAEQMSNSRKEAWQQIDSSLDLLTVMSKSWTVAENKNRLAEVGAVLAEFNTVQERIESVAHTNENIPAFNTLILEAAPIAKKLLLQITTLIDIEAGLESTSARKSLLKDLADARGSFAVGLADIRAFLLTGDKKFKEAFVKGWREGETSVEKIRSNLSLLKKEQKLVFQNFYSLRKTFSVLPEKMFQQRESENWNQANYLLSTEAAPRARKLKALLEEMVISQENLLKNDSISSRENANFISNIIIIGSIAILLLGILIAYFMTQSILRSLLPAVTRAKLIAEGDLSGSPLLLRSKDELGDLTQAVNTMSLSLREVMDKTVVSIDEVAEGTTKIEQSNVQMAGSVDRQTEMIDMVVTSVEELTVSAEEVAKNSVGSADNASLARQAAEQGGALIDSLFEDIEKISTEFSLSSDAVNNLSQLGGKIENIISVINGIAEQTNLLALNAAIEAARAGDQGKGFAVVADEVRQLAQRTTEATEEVSAVVGSIQSSTHDTSSLMRSSAEKVSSGLEAARTAKDSLVQIIDSSIRVENNIQTIASIAEQQSQVVQEVASNMNSLAQAAGESEREVRAVLEVVNGLKLTASSKAKEIKEMLN